MAERSWFLCLGLLSVIGRGAALGDDASVHPLIPGFERFHAQEPSRVEAGLLLLGELNCVSCHRAESWLDDHVDTRQAPVLDGVGTRVRVEYLRAFLADPSGRKPGTAMPHVLAHQPEGERQRQVESLVHFLATTGAVTDVAAEARHLDNGRKLFHEVGCTACHEPQTGDPLRGSISVPLGDLAEKYTVPALIEFLEDPLRIRPSGRMPGPALNPGETRDVAHYLLRDLVGIASAGRADLPRVPYAYYEGEWQQLPDFEALEPAATGRGAAFDVSLARRPHNFALRFEAWLRLEHAGDYTFELTSDDGSKLWINDELVVDNDGVHAPVTKTGRVRLEAGDHQVTVGLFQLGGGVELEVLVAGPALRRQPLALLVAPSPEALDARPDPESEPGEEVFTFRPALAEQGRSLFVETGCASCHRMTEDDRPLESAASFRQAAKPLADLDPEAGCLDPAAARAPRYPLTTAQKRALAAALEAVKSPLPDPEPDQRIAATFTRLNCYACHERGQVGGVEPARNALFLTTQQEMGDEGRIPPHLDGVGAKLTAEWFARIFAEGSTDRPYMRTRMPRFGENAGHLVAVLGSIDELEPVPPIAFDEPDGRIKALGRHMAGDKALGCVKCHNFNGIAATGVQSIDLTILTRRLQRDWFHRYMLNPQDFRPGTRMPAAWPGGFSTLPSVLDGHAARQIEAIWQYLSDGPQAGVPYGLAREMIELVPEDEALLYRNFIEGAGTRAIGVGYPEKAHLAFDANELRLALIWQGAFIDASMHWIGRGPGFQRPLGDHVLALPEGPSFAVLEGVDSAWPEGAPQDDGWRFRGYRLSPDRRPTFLYECGPLRVEDFPNAVAGDPYPSLRRRLTVTSDGSPPNVYFRAASAGTIAELGDGWYAIGEDLRMRLVSEATPVLVQSGERTELRVPVPAAGGGTVIVQEFVW